jgi:hypothetical protein
LHGVAGESADIVEREGVGLTFEPENSAELTKKIHFLAQDQEARRKFSLRGPEAAKHYDRAYLAASMLAVLEETAARAAEVASPKRQRRIL